MFNRYTYVGNDPINETDPTGQCPWCVAFLVNTAINAAIQYAETGEVNMGAAVVAGAVDTVNPAAAAVKIAKVSKLVGAAVVASKQINKATSKRTDFVVDSNGTAVRNSTSGAKADLEDAGFVGSSTTQTTERGTQYSNIPGKDGPMDIRVMDGQASGGNKGPRVVTRESGSNQQVKTDGSKFRQNEPRRQREQESHIQLAE